ncbi:MAG: hypothetical protein V4793_47225, partial [Paraburkholderia tropica]
GSEATLVRMNFMRINLGQTANVRSKNRKSQTQSLNRNSIQVKSKTISKRRKPIGSRDNRSHAAKGRGRQEHDRDASRRSIPRKR